MTYIMRVYHTLLRSPYGTWTKSVVGETMPNDIVVIIHTVQLCWHKWALVLNHRGKVGWIQFDTKDFDHVQ